MTGSQPFLSQLSGKFGAISKEHPVPTRDFASACECILPIFDHLGSVFSFARTELAQKNDSLKIVQEKLATLDAVVDADFKAGKLTTKNSCARNLFRLLSGISFISQLLQNLTGDKNKTLRQAAGEAYDATLSSAHGYMVRMAVKGSMYMLPTRENFLASIHETEDSAKLQAKEFATRVDILINRISALYKGTNMPMSDARGI